MTNIHFSSKSDYWETPQELYNNLNKVFNFEFDPCSSHKNHKCAKYLTKEEDGLITPWEGKVFMNPPYGREIGKWVYKAYYHDDLVVALLPARTDTRWWQDYCMKADVIKFIKGRLKFINRELPSYREDDDFKVSPAPFPSAVVIFNLFKEI